MIFAAWLLAASSSFWRWSRVAFFSKKSETVSKSVLLVVERLASLRPSSAKRALKISFIFGPSRPISWKISKVLSFDEKFEILPQVNLTDFRFRFESNLRYWLLENLSLNLTLIDTYDTQLAPNVGRNDLQIRSSVGIKF